jgi:hypothetical protein
MSKTFRVTRQVIYSQELEIQAETEDQAIELAKTTSYSTEDKTFLDTDYYEAEEIEKEPETTPAPSDTVRCTNCNFIGAESELAFITADEQEDKELILNYEITGKGVTHCNQQPQGANVVHFNGCPNCLTDAYLMDIK